MNENCGRVTCSDDSAVGAIGDKLGIGWRRVETAVTRSVAVIVDRQLPFPAERAARDERAPREDARVVDQVAGRRIVRTVQHNVVAGHYVHRVATVQLDVVDGNADEGVERANRMGQWRGFWKADGRLAVHDLSVQVAQLDAVVIHHAQFTDASRRQVNGRRAAKSSRSQNQHRRLA